MHPVCFTSPCFLSFLFPSNMSSVRYCFYSFTHVWSVPVSAATDTLQPQSGAIEQSQRSSRAINCRALSGSPVPFTAWLNCPHAISPRTQSHPSCQCISRTHVNAVHLSSTTRSSRKSTWEFAFDLANHDTPQTCICALYSEVLPNLITLRVLRAQARTIHCTTASRTIPSRRRWDVEKVGRLGVR
ncbi:hypothetical protein CGRA01v4_09112 [Colletotrichum graminicola]|nr:hypothetical protein CGRA01v4_09112 [Colletotrichum graminicola]